jgi:hypothetical protein
MSSQAQQIYGSDLLLLRQGCGGGKHGKTLQREYGKDNEPPRHRERREKINKKIKDSTQRREEAIPQGGFAQAQREMKI